MNYYSSMDGLNHILQCRWNVALSTTHVSGVKEREFPNGKGCILDLYYKFEEEMNRKWHPNVNLGAAVSGDQLLTDHGVEHVKSVIAHAKDILSDIERLNGYEIYLLLVSIHFHDLGNISGREQHEQKIAEIIDKMGNDLPLDTSEKELVTSIATAHGGYVDKLTRNKDTIRQVSPDTHYDGISIHPKVLASILRFADEISDDLNRSNFNGIDIPRENEVYHEYSKALTPVSILGDTIRFKFRIPYDLTQKKIGKGNEEIFLYDEILNRMSKCMCELEYCRKYANGLIRPTTLDITIDVLKEGSSFQIIRDMGDSFRLTLHGYPNKNTSGLFDYLDVDDDSTGNTKSLKYEDGDSLCSAIKEKEEK